jgi:hypothetical protein
LGEGVKLGNRWETKVESRLFLGYLFTHFVV